MRYVVQARVGVHMRQRSPAATGMRYSRMPVDRKSQQALSHRLA